MEESTKQAPFPDLIRNDKGVYNIDIIKTRNKMIHDINDKTSHSIEIGGLDRLVKSVIHSPKCGT